MARPATAAVRLLSGGREPVRLATTGNIILRGLQTIDGVATAVGDRVLVKDQADQTQNGIYTASEGQWFRAADARTARTMQKGTTVHVQEGALSADWVYAFETQDPVIGADPIVLAFYLSQDTLGGVVDAASAAAASAAAALASKNAGATSATNAAGSATAASSSATAASGSAANAAASATNAGNSAAAAAGSASTAAGSAASAGASASAAAGSASAASSSAAAASGSATNAATSAGNAVASAAAAANAVAALGYTFSTGTADADPGNGTLRLNNVAAASATVAYIDNLDSSGATVSGILDMFDDSTNTIKGQLTLRSKASAAIAYVYNVTGPVVDGGGYRKLTLAFANGAGALPTTPDGIWLIFTRAGDKGADGTGVGNFIGSASSVADNIVTFAGTTGKVGKDSGVAVGSLVTGPASAIGDNLATFNGATGKVVKDSGIAVSSLAPKASPAFTGTPTAPSAAPGTNTTQIATTAFVKSEPLADAQLPARLGTVAKLITDWNSGLDNGWYMGTSAANAPVDPGGSTWCIGNVEAHGSTGWRTQTVHFFTTDGPSDTKVYRRAQNNGIWEAWYKLSIAQAEQDARYVRKAYESSPGTFATGGLYTYSHGLGVIPNVCLAFLRCISSDVGYVAGEQIIMPMGHFGGSWGYALSADATNVYVRMGSAGLPVIEKTTGNGVGITASKWNLNVKAYA